ncbi:MAG: hypothetical protein ABSB35_38555 [Bryobacteraceae bacterium]|jgi:hypothetical protein
MIKKLAFCVFLAGVVLATGGWGARGHISANRAAVLSISDDGPVFLRSYTEWIAQPGPLPDSWRVATEPYSKLFEDPNHGWFKEQFAFMKVIPRSRYEFVLALYDEYLRIKTSDPHARHTTTNIRNAAREIYRYGVPFDKKALITTDPSQSRYIEDPDFEKRCLKELGYAPLQLLGRTSAFDLEFLPRIESLQADPLDPLDP